MKKTMKFKEYLDDEFKKENSKRGTKSKDSDKKIKRDKKRNYGD